MKFTSAELVEQVIWDMRVADQPRSLNRANVDDLFNGSPPWTTAEQETAQIRTNVNWLEAPKLAADARRTYMNAFLKSERFFTVTVDAGPPAKRATWGNIITKEINRALKHSITYFELLRNQFAMTVLHGIGPALWDDDYHWCPNTIGIEDVMIPSGTRLTMDNLDYFAVFRQFTPMQLYEKIHGPKTDPGWNKPLADEVFKWVHAQDQAQHSYGDIYSPERVVERFKEDGGFYGTDAVPTVDCWDFWYWAEEGKQQGWKHCIVLDTPMKQEISVGNNKTMPAKNKYDLKHGDFLYDGRNRFWCDDIRQIIHFQFGDCSAKAPFKYHTVRSLGWLLYAVCHVQNRLRCKVNDATFESLLQYFRVSTAEDHERITKIELQNYGVIPDGVDFVKQGDRWKVDFNLVGTTIQQNRAMMTETAAQFREGRDQQQGGVEKTATQIMAEVNSANALVGSLLLLAYTYQRPQYDEIVRRFCIKNSADPQVRNVQKRILSRGVPESILDATLLSVEPERALGHGNKTLEIAMADKLMGVRALLDPSAQRQVLRKYVLANSDDPDWASDAVPEEKLPSDSFHDAQLMFGVLMEGVPVIPVSGQNPIEIAGTLVQMTARLIVTREKYQIEPTKRDLIGFKNILVTINQYLQMAAEDKDMAPTLKMIAADFAKLQQAVKLYEKKLTELLAQQPQTPQGDPKDAAKAQAMVLQAQTKAQLAAQSHAQKTQQRAVQFQQKLKQDSEKHAAEMRKKLDEEQVNVAATDMKTAAEIERENARAENAPVETEAE